MGEGLCCCVGPGVLPLVWVAAMGTGRPACLGDPQEEPQVESADHVPTAGSVSGPKELQGRDGHRSSVSMVDDGTLPGPAAPWPGGTAPECRWRGYRGDRSEAKAGTARR